MSGLKNQQNFFLIILSIIVILGTLYFFSDFKINKNSQSNNEDRIKNLNIDVNSFIGTLPPLGNPNAPIKIIEFGDFHCPFCAQVPRVVLNNLQQYIDNNLIVFYFRDFPLDQIHPFSRNVHLASRCANEQGKYWEFHKKAFDDFINGLGQKTGDKDYLFNLAKSLSLDINKFEECYNNRKYENEINNDYNQGIQLGIQGTPSFLINNMFIQGLDTESINKAIGLLLQTNQSKQ
ncbi:MAG: hypothetical protein KatS3mg095_0097 [Candidatus Parcubacteria bacterium]|nr:MAG: hypothetical protein KatS3mg095_0097 [Candidatus Parcubacteria bacterium]